MEVHIAHHEWLEESIQQELGYPNARHSILLSWRECRGVTWMLLVADDSATLSSAQRDHLPVFDARFVCVVVQRSAPVELDEDEDRRDERNHAESGHPRFSAPSRLGRCRIINTRTSRQDAERDQRDEPGDRNPEQYRYEVSEHDGAVCGRRADTWRASSVQGDEVDRAPRSPVSRRPSPHRSWRGGSTESRESLQRREPLRSERRAFCTGWPRVRPQVDGLC